MIIASYEGTYVEFKRKKPIIHYNVGFPAFQTASTEYILKQTSNATRILKFMLRVFKKYLSK